MDQQQQAPSRFLLTFSDPCLEAGYLKSQRSVILTSSCGYAVIVCIGTSVGLITDALKGAYHPGLSSFRVLDFSSSLTLLWNFNALGFLLGLLTTLLPGNQMRGRSLNMARPAFLCFHTVFSGFP